MKPEVQLAMEQLQELRTLAQTTTELAARLSGQAINNVLEVGTWTFDTSAVKVLSWNAACGAIQIRNLGGNTIAVVSGTPAVEPAQGTGLYLIPKGVLDIVNVASHTVTVFGTANDTFSYQAFTVGGAPIGIGTFL